MWYVYIVECSDGTLYTGISTNVNKRIIAHNKGKGAKYTSTRKPVVLRALFEAIDRGIKQLSREAKLKLCDIYG
jgi:putative endonuclease